jgi:hypothetical protein
MDKIHEVLKPSATGHQTGLMFPPGHTEGQILALDSATGSVGPTLNVNAIVGFAQYSFSFNNQGGTDNLLPGRPTTQTAAFTPPSGAGAAVFMRSFSGAFVTDGGAHLTERPLGEFEANVFFSGSNRLSCTVMLSDSNGDDPVQVTVSGLLIYFR